MQLVSKRLKNSMTIPDTWLVMKITIKSTSKFVSTITNRKIFPIHNLKTLIKINYSVTSTFIDDLMERDTKSTSTKNFLCEICEFPAVALLFITMVQAETEINIASLPGNNTPSMLTVFRCFNLMSLMSLRSEHIFRQR